MLHAFHSSNNGTLFESVLVYYHLLDDKSSLLINDIDRIVGKSDQITKENDVKRPCVSLE